MVSVAAVLDSTCLIGLENIGRLDIVEQLLQPAYAPPAVEQEFGAKPPWLQIVVPANKALVTSLQMMVDAGEAEAITLALEMDVRIILDDRKAREVAMRLGIQVTGTLGLLLKAKEAGIISQIKPILTDLESNHFHIAPRLMLEALRLAREATDAED